MADFFDAQFTGTGDLSAYTPDVGSAMTSPSTDNVLIGSTYLHGLSTTAMLAYMVRVTSGSFQETVINPWGQNFVLYTAQAPTGANYYMETTLLLDPATDVNYYAGHSMRGIRGTGGEADYFDGIGAVFNVDETDHTHRNVDVYFDKVTERAAAPSVTFTPVLGGGSVTGIALGAATTVTVRTEIEGNTLRGFVNGTRVIESTFSDSGYFTAAGKMLWNFQHNTISGPTYSWMKVDRITAGDTFIVPPSAFWTRYVKSVEVDS